MLNNYQITQQSFIIGSGSGDFALTKLLPTLFRDEAPRVNPRLTLEVYFNDVYKLLLRKLARFESESEVNEDDITKLNSLFDEFKKVKKMLGELPTTNKTDN